MSEQVQRAQGVPVLARNITRADRAQIATDTYTDGCSGAIASVAARLALTLALLQGFLIAGQYSGYGCSCHGWDLQFCLLGASL